MRRKGRIQGIALLLAGLFLMGSTNVLPVSAGASKYVIDKTSFEKELDTSLWSNPDSDVIVKDGIIIIPDASTDTTSLITTLNAKKSEYHSEIISAEVSMHLTQLPQNEIFIMAFGLPGIEAAPGEEGSIEIQFVDDNGLKVSVEEFDEYGESSVLVDNVSCGTVGNVKVKSSISKDKVLNLNINGKTVYDGKISASGEGFFGFLQTGSCGAEIKDLRIVSYGYDRPENTNIVEDFEKGVLNTNVLTSRMVYPSSEYAPSRVFIDEVNGNHVFRFQNCALSYIGTRHQYSNFNIQFDMVYLQRENVYNEEGDLVTPQNGNFAISFGDEAAEYDGYGYDTSTDLIVFYPNSIVESLYTKENVKATDLGYPFYDESCNKNFTVRISMVDSVVGVYMKWQDETEFKEMMKYQVSESTPTGYIHIWTTGLNNNFAIDNLQITNLDQDANVIEAGYKSALVEKPDDYTYEPMTRVYQEKTEEKEFNVYLIILGVAGICLVTLIVAMLPRKNRRDGGAVEKNY